MKPKIRFFGFIKNTDPTPRRRQRQHELISCFALLAPAFLVLQFSVIGRKLERQHARVVLYLPLFCFAHFNRRCSENSRHIAHLFTPSAADGPTPLSANIAYPCLLQCSNLSFALALHSTVRRALLFAAASKWPRIIMPLSFGFGPLVHS